MTRNLLHTNDVLDCIAQFVTEQQAQLDSKDLSRHYKIAAANEIALRIKLLGRGGLTVIEGGKK